MESTQRAVRACRRIPGHDLPAESQARASPDALRELFRREALHSPAFENSAYLEQRARVVGWLANVCEGLGLGRHSIHSSVNLVDRVCTKARVSPDMLLSFAASAILISSKIQDRLDDEPPLISEILAVDPTRSIRARDVRDCEIAVLKFLDWRVLIATPYDFAIDLCASGLVCPNDSITGQVVDEESRARLMEFVFYFCDVSVKEKDFLKFKPSMCTAAAICAAREGMHIFPVWTPSLEAKTGYSLDDLSRCAWLLTSIFTAESSEASDAAAGIGGSMGRGVPIPGATSPPSSVVPIAAVPHDPVVGMSTPTRQIAADVFKVSTVSPTNVAHDSFFFAAE